MMPAFRKQRRTLSRLCGLSADDRALNLLAGLLLGKAQFVILLQIYPELGTRAKPTG